jgi:hypothetical protein
MISIPRGLIQQRHGGVKFDFHWIDNVAPSENSTDFLQHGDSAPDRRFSYRYEAAD